ncbi:hypothetical protein QZH41_006968 [Actinostola sp. cb2023]|nr:hypothetical protein QZH41_006968 [Actinostola sp. cb2023]
MLSRTGFRFAPIIASMLLLVFQVSEGRITRSKQCTFPGYVPGGAIPEMSAIHIEPKKFEETVMDKVLVVFSDKTGTADKTIERALAASKLFEEAPFVGTALAIISGAMEFVSDEPDPNEILEKAQQSVLLLQNEINVRLDQMRDYVDVKDLESERRDMTNTYKELFDKWSKCARKPTKEDADRCQRTAEEDISSARFHFQQKQTMFDQKNYRNGKRMYDPNFTYRYVATWQWMKKYAGSHVWAPTHYDVKLLESGLIGFRDYASLHLLSLATLAATYKDERGQSQEDCNYFQHYMEKMEKKADYYVEYVKWAYEWIYIRQYEENMYFGIPKRAGGGASADRGGFLGTRECPGKCTIQCSQMVTDNVCTVQGGIKKLLMVNAYDACESYMGAMKKTLVDFWTKEVLNLAKIWEKYREEAKNRSC